MNESKNVLVDKSFAFAIRVVKFYKYLVANQKEFVLSKQLLRIGTSIGAMVRESQNAESKSDFIHKLSIAQKECDESNYWLELLFAVEYIHEAEFKSLKDDAMELLKIIRSIIITSKK